MIIKSIRISVFVLAVSIAANAQNFQARIADLDEKASELQRRLHENELRLQRHSEVMEEAQARLKALQAGEKLPARIKTPAAPPEPVHFNGKTPAPSPIAPKQRLPNTQTFSPIPARHVEVSKKNTYYFQIFSGYVMPNNAHIHSSGRVPPENNLAEYDNGYSVGAGAGIDFGNWRIGMELSHRSYDNSESGKGHAELNTLMINGGWEIGFLESNIFYIGGGLGPSLVKIQRSSGYWSYNKNLLAYHLGTGLGYRFSESLSGRFGYKYFSTASANDFDPHGSHALEATLEIDL
ncbi:MAG: outer membrane beta-barrel protein [Opitutae bacterium]|jgi:opacity protein-like surface antigen|nr:outer membrane beta-barrel protein [Opitutae bacterium]MBT4667324.1 outer membrane beta-barrel protein [Opitutae bacterium]MBT5908158.1 outer membrane beta-barrel protein [Opitutae bacterium]MBT7743042.1 outer membrane beta-barrel protein [Opitutae bacterium]MBT7922655.1 outer membrane beta-barrel protein [Opitutae bacterium]